MERHQPPRGGRPEERQHDQSRRSAFGATAAERPRDTATNHSGAAAGGSRIRGVDLSVFWDERFAGRVGVRLRFQIVAEPATSFVVVRTAEKESIENARITRLVPVYPSLEEDLPHMNGWCAVEPDRAGTFEEVEMSAKRNAPSENGLSCSSTSTVEKARSPLCDFSGVYRMDSPASKIALDQTLEWGHQFVLGERPLSPLGDTSVVYPTYPPSDINGLDQELRYGTRFMHGERQNFSEVPCDLVVDGPVASLAGPPAQAVALRQDSRALIHQAVDKTSCPRGAKDQSPSEKSGTRPLSCYDTNSTCSVEPTGVSEQGFSSVIQSHGIKSPSVKIYDRPCLHDVRSRITSPGWGSDEMKQVLLKGIKRGGSQETVIVTPGRTLSSGTAETTSSPPSPTPIPILRNQPAAGKENNEDNQCRLSKDSKAQGTPCPAHKKQGSPQLQKLKSPPARKVPWKAPSISDLSPSSKDCRVSSKLTTLPVLKSVNVEKRKRRHSLNSPVKLKTRRQNRTASHDLLSLPPESVNGSASEGESPIRRTGAFEGSPYFLNGKLAGFRRFEIEAEEFDMEKEGGVPTTSDIEGTCTTEMREDVCLTRLTSGDNRTRSADSSMDIAPRPTWTDMNGMLCIHFSQGIAIESYEVELEATIILPEIDSRNRCCLELRPLFRFFSNSNEVDFSALGFLELCLNPLSLIREADVKVTVKNLVETWDNTGDAGMRGIFRLHNLPTIEFQHKEDVRIVSEFSMEIIMDVSVLTPEGGPRALAYHIAVTPLLASTEMFARRALFEFCFKNMSVEFQDVMKLYSDTDDIVYCARVNDHDGHEDGVLVQVMRDAAELEEVLDLHIEIPWNFIQGRPFSPVTLRPATPGGRVVSEIMYLTLPPKPILLEVVPRMDDSLSGWDCQSYKLKGIEFLRLTKKPMPANFPEGMRDHVVLRAAEYENLAFGALRIEPGTSKGDQLQIFNTHLCHDLTVSIYEACGGKLRCQMEFSVRRAGAMNEKLLEIVRNGWEVQYAAVDGLLSDQECGLWKVSESDNIELYSYDDYEANARRRPFLGDTVEFKICFQIEKSKPRAIEAERWDKLGGMPSGLKTNDHKLPTILHKTFLDVEMRCDVLDGHLTIINDPDRYCICPRCHEDATVRSERSHLPRLMPGYEMSLWFPPKEGKIGSRKALLASKYFALRKKGPLSLTTKCTHPPYADTAKNWRSRISSPLRPRGSRAHGRMSDGNSSSSSSSFLEDSPLPGRFGRIASPTVSDRGSCLSPNLHSILRSTKPPSPTKLVHWKEEISEVINPVDKISPSPESSPGNGGVLDAPTDGGIRTSVKEGMGVQTAAVDPLREEHLKEEGLTRERENAPKSLGRLAPQPTKAKIYTDLTFACIVLVFVHLAFIAAILSCAPSDFGNYAKVANSASTHKEIFNVWPAHGDADLHELHLKTEGMTSRLGPMESAVVAEVEGTAAAAAASCSRLMTSSFEGGSGSLSTLDQLASSSPLGGEGLESTSSGDWNEQLSPPRMEVVIASAGDVVQPFDALIKDGSLDGADSGVVGDSDAGYSFLDWIDYALGWKEQDV